MASGRAPGVKGGPTWWAAPARGARLYSPTVVRHLYVHIPFCQRRCSYCDFSIAVRKRVPGSEYVHAVLRELDLLRSSPGWVNPGAGLDTLYLGGGTPSLLPPEAIQRLLHELTLTFRIPHSALSTMEVTLEANPEDVTPASACLWKASGVNRVSLGAQSFDDHVLKWMHRSHDAARIGAAVHTLRGAGIDNISLDLIFALPEELHRDWSRDLDQAIALLPSHLSLYGLTVEPRTPLDRWISRGATTLPADDRYAEEYLFAHRRLTAEGFHFYEVSNASLHGRISRHNSAYWSGSPYLGLGPAAHSFDGRTRRWNLSAWESYRRAVADGRSAVESEEALTPEQQDLEHVYLALRTSEGLDLSAPYRPLPPVTAQWVERGWVETEGGKLRCTPEGWLRLDHLVAKLFSTKELSQP
jgi:putative oxygen-independent coproporphyrinogen III oxidase